MIVDCPRAHCPWRAIITGRFGGFTVTEMLFVVVAKQRTGLWFAWRARDVAEDWLDAHILVNHNHNSNQIRETR